MEISFKMPSENTKTGSRKLGRRVVLSIARLNIVYYIEFKKTPQDA